MYFCSKIITIFLISKINLVILSLSTKKYNIKIWNILQKCVSLQTILRNNNGYLYMKHYLQLIRPIQWIKNIFVFAPIFFSNHLLEIDYLLPTTIIFFSFCLVSSSIYCFNDLIDVEADRHHPQKCHRPIASGLISIRGGYIMMTICMLGSIALLTLVRNQNTLFLYIILISYWLMNIGYTLRLKQVAIIDVTIIATGFVMRVLIGGLTTDVWVSQWLILMTFLLTLFMAIAKRGDDFTIFENTGIKPRQSITGYNKGFINGANSIIVAVTIVCYIMYTMSNEVIERIGSQYLYLTSVWVLLALLRYLQKTIVYGYSGDPTKLLTKDLFIQLCVLGWIVSFFIIIYLH